MEIIELSKSTSLVDNAIKYFHECWSNALSFDFFRDCIINSMKQNPIIPKFYLLLNREKIIGSYALLTNDFISRQDLAPWFACLFVNKEYRNRGYAGQLLDHGIKETFSKGYGKLYLKTDLAGFYENKGWRHESDGYNVTGEQIKIYSINTSQLPLRTNCRIKDN